MDNPFQLPCEFQYHLIIPSMLTGLQVVWRAHGTPVGETNRTPLFGTGLEEQRELERIGRDSRRRKGKTHVELNRILVEIHSMLDGFVQRYVPYNQ